MPSYATFKLMLGGMHACMVNGDDDGDAWW